MAEREMTGNEKYQMNTPMYEGPKGYFGLVTHAVEFSDFPSQRLGPVLAVYCDDENGKILVEPRSLAGVGVGVTFGPQFRLSDLAGMDHSDDPWFPKSKIPFTRWRDLAIKHAPKETP